MAALVLNNLTAQSKNYSHQSLIYSILMLDNDQFDLFWLSFSHYTNIPVQELKCAFNTLATNILSNNYTQELDSFQFRKSVYRQQSQSVIQFRNLFTGVLKRVLNVFFKTDLNKSSEKEICLFLNANVKMSDKTAFWKEVAQYINGKTNKQIQDYYCHSYQNVIYDRQLSTQDKNILRYLNEFWQDQRPVFVADKFLEMTSEKDYFKHNIIMYIINVRR
ncbi:SANT/Myb_domain [Hexamita inflata]|uniref:SANT/Myb domain n=1 Tax=Hexamita inflata TaxID=28002 RepID=A0AA86V5T9_9EUKA|nr:SANT/Myb domain [Hexamita inflata]